MTDSTRKVLTLRHEATGRLVPVEVTTVVGRNDTYYRYTDTDERKDRLRGDVAEGLAALNYIKVSSDSQISRTHGVIEPTPAAVSDLNSTNGTFLNEQRLPTRKGEQGPKVSIKHGDALLLGQQRFAVELWEVTTQELEARVASGRRGFIASDWSRLERAERIARHLEERKGFTMRPAVGWAAAIANCYHLQSSADADGVTVIGFSAEVNAGDLLFDKEPMSFAKVLPIIARIPGRKVVVLDVDGDPTACEHLFASNAYEDMLLIASVGGPPLESAEISLSVAIGTNSLDGMKKSAAGDEGLRGAFDDAVDGLDALLSPDTNVLAVDWLKSYHGRLKVTFGGRLREDDSWLSHSLRMGSTTFRF